MTAEAADRIVADYLAALMRHLPAGRRTRAAIRAELADGLACAIEARTDRGVDPARAAAEAIAEFGEPRVVARAFAGQLLQESTHRIGVGLLFGGPLVGLLWLLATPGPGWHQRLSDVLTLVPAYPVVLAIVVPAALVAVRADGRLAVPAAQVAALGCIAGDACLLTAAVVDGRTGLALVAAAASLARLTIAALAGRRVTRLRAAAS